MKFPLTLIPTPLLLFLHHYCYSCRELFKQRVTDISTLKQRHLCSHHLRTRQLARGRNNAPSIGTHEVSTQKNARPYRPGIVGSCKDQD